MSKIFTQTLTSNDNLKAIQKQATHFFWDINSPGMYQGIKKDYKQGEYIGIMLFTELSKKNWKKKNIKSISFNFFATSSGNFSLYECVDKMDLASEKEGSYFEGKAIGSLSHSSGNNIITLSNNSNSEIFFNLIQYLQSADSVQNICLSDKSQVDKVYRITTITLTIEYEEGIVYYGISENWKPCLVYYGINGGWQQVTPFYGVNEKWQQLGEG